MKTRRLLINSQHSIADAIQCLKQGGVIAFPTDTVYGIAADIHNESALEKIYTIKERSTTKALPVLVSENNQLSLLVKQGTANVPAVKLSKCFWPGALTLIFKKNESISTLISQTDTIGIRMPNYMPVLELIQQTGPLAVTSANLSGHENCLTADEVLEQLDRRIDLILDGGKTNGLQASTVVDCTHGDNITILREGIITQSMIEDCLNA